MNPILKAVSRFSFIKFIGDNETMPVMRFKRLHRFANGRFTFIWPFIEDAKPAIKTSLRVGALHFHDIHTADGIPFTIQFTVLYKFDPEAIGRPIAAQLIEAPVGTLGKIINDYSEHAVRKVVARFTAEEMLTATVRTQLQQSIGHYLRHSISSLGLFVLPVEGVLLKQITPHERFRQNLLMANKWHATLEVMAHYANSSVLEQAIRGALVDSLEHRSGDTNLVAPPFWPAYLPEAASQQRPSLLPQQPINGRSRQSHSSTDPKG
ncbi:MAG: SPFH domain-containing protein [Candidatus Promineifilaceae bacterium]